jgi:hypothetical protein
MHPDLDYDAIRDRHISPDELPVDEGALDSESHESPSLVYTSGESIRPAFARPAAPRAAKKDTRA